MLPAHAMGDLGAISSRAHGLEAIDGDKTCDVMYVLWDQEMAHGSVRLDNSVTSHIPQNHAGPRVAYLCCTILSPQIPALLIVIL